MEIVLVNIVLLLFLVFFYQRTRHGLHILQLENYYNDRYAVLMTRYIKTVLNINIIVLFLIPIILFLLKEIQAGLILSIIAYLALILTFRKKKEKKAFVVTARIRRMYMTYLVLFFIAAVFANTSNYVIVISILNVCAMIAYTFVYIVNLINKPIEKSIRKGFCIKANRK